MATNSCALPRFMYGVVRSSTFVCRMKLSMPSRNNKSRTSRAGAAVVEVRGETAETGAAGVCVDVVAVVEEEVAGVLEALVCAEMAVATCSESTPDRIACPPVLRATAPFRGYVCDAILEKSAPCFAYWPATGIIRRIPSRFLQNTAIGGIARLFE